MENLNESFAISFTQFISAHPSLQALTLFIATDMVYVIPLALLSSFLFVRSENRGNYAKKLLSVFLVTIVAWGIVFAIKYFFPLPRPHTVLSEVVPLFLPRDSASYPSGHSAVFSSLAFSLLFLKEKKLGSVLLCIALCVGVARVGAGVHYPFDIFAGFLVGLLSAFFTLRALKA